MAHLLKYIHVHSGTEFQFEVIQSAAEAFAGRQRPAPQIGVLDVRKQLLHPLPLLWGDQTRPLMLPWGAARWHPLLPLPAFPRDSLVWTTTRRSRPVQGERKEVVGEGGPAAIHVQEAVEGGRGAVGAWKALFGGLVVVHNDDSGGNQSSDSLSLVR